MSTTWLIKLVLSHLLTDFILQPKGWIEDRSKNHFGSAFLYVHTVITAGLAPIFIGFEYWYFALIIFITHTLIDGWKSYRPQQIQYFIIDQALHLLVIAGCWYYNFYTPEDLKQLWASFGTNIHFWVILTGFVFVSFPSAIMIGQLTKKWSDQLPGGPGLANAGKWIGILERIIILIFILQNQYAALGLLITAKGLLRFSEKDRQEEKTEYVLIGSLISISVAVVTGIIIKQLL